MLPEKEIELEKQRLNKEIKDAIDVIMHNLDWSSYDLSKANNKCPSTASEFINKDGNYETNTLVENSYYMGCRVKVVLVPYTFSGYKPEKKTHIRK